MRACAVAMILLGAASAAAEDEVADTAVRDRLRHHARDAPPEPLLHLDAFAFAREDAEGGLVDRHGTSLALGPRTRLAVEGTWWQSGLSPSMFAADLALHGWRAGAELSYDLGPFRIGASASMSRYGDSSHRMVGLFAYRTFRLSRWMHAWIMLGLAHERWGDTRTNTSMQGTYLGLSLGTTFR